MRNNFRMHFYSADRRGVAENADYPNEHVITDQEGLRKACQMDFVCAKYKDDHRSKANFIFSDCLAMDCDNDHSDDPKEWKTPQDVQKIFKGVVFAVQYSRHHNQPKGSKSARPRFHIFFPIYRNEDHKDYALIKARVLKEFPWFDKGAVDAARFFYGTENPQVEIYDGEILLDDLFLEQDFPSDQDFSQIPEGQRYVTLRDFAASILTRFGACDKAEHLFFRRAADCNPPMSDEELKKIWANGLTFYDKVISRAEGYIPPEVYNGEKSYKPAFFTDKAQAEMLRQTFGDYVAYTDSTKFLVYTGTFWKENQHAPWLLAYDLSMYQLREAINAKQKALRAMSDDSQGLIKSKSKTVVKNHIDSDQFDLYEQYLAAERYQEEAEKRQNAKGVENTLKALTPMVHLDIAAFDEQPFLLNTPQATYDLRKGLAGARKHDPADRITKITAVSPSHKGEDTWKEFLNTIFKSDQDLIDYVQEICGLAAIGRIYFEALIIAYGDGANGKSTFWNTIARVLGNYSGQVSAETLTLRARHNVKAEMAELRGKRLSIAAELGSNRSLNDSVVKQLCSTDPIQADRKYKDPFNFVPQHTLILYTNNLPKVSGRDRGIWRRLVVIPFKATITGESDIKNYGETLFEEAGPAILSWIIEGAKRIIDKNFKLVEPQSVIEATKAYRDDNDWLKRFIDDCCLIGADLKDKSADIYEVYVSYAQRNHEDVQDSPVFWKALQKTDLKDVKITKRREIFGNEYVHVCHGLALKPQFKNKEGFEFEEEEDLGF